MTGSGMQFRNVSRREFLNYVWAGSLAIFMAATGGAVLAFSMPRFKEGEFGGTFTVGTVADKLPAPDAPPVNYPDLKFWLINVGPNEAAKGGGIQGLVAVYKVCVHLGCLYAWVDSTARFECPCHGSKYQEDGTYIEGPAPRDLDRFKVMVVGTDDQPVAQTIDDKSSPNYGAPIPVPTDGNLVIKVDTGVKIDMGKRHYYQGGQPT
ncbi:MAG TPA: ubiquinol-cytochrome c reductase iron-sulfur subunit [Anaerolineae bacterium]|nr:ubiquinol-cytochrome c reductase iron-sulfur subunit [Anaerolineae bacterium]